MNTRIKRRMNDCTPALVWKGMWVVTDMISSALVYDFSVPNDSERNMSRSGPI
jgi:hypothetical protein